MRKLIFTPLLFLALNAFAQEAPQQAAPPPPPPVNPGGPGPNGPMDPPDIVTTGQVGTDTLKNGKDTIKLNMHLQMEMQRGQASENYVVMLTPDGDCSEVSVVEKKPSYFLVKLQKGGSTPKGSFDYAVFLKQKRPTRPHGLPPAAGQGPHVNPTAPQAPPPPQPQGGQ